MSRKDIKRIIEILALRILFAALIAWIILYLCSCTQVIVKTQDLYDDMAPLVIDQKPVGDMVTVKVNTLFKDIDFGDLWYKDVFGIEKYKGTPQDANVMAPWGWMRTVNPGGGQ